MEKEMKSKNKEVKKLNFPDWQEKWIKGRIKGLSATYITKEKRRYRTIKINNIYKVEEGMVLDNLQKELGSEKDYQREQKHFIGYHYVSLIKNKNKDVFWFQGNIDSKLGYRFFYSDVTSGDIKDFKSYKGAFREFNKLLEKKLNIRIRGSVAK